MSGLFPYSLFYCTIHVTNIKMGVSVVKTPLNRMWGGCYIKVAQKENFRIVWNAQEQWIPNNFVKALHLWDTHLLQEPPEQGELLLLIISLHNVCEAEQRQPLPAAPHCWAVDLRALLQWGEEATVITVDRPYDEVGRYTGVISNGSLCLL